MEQKPSFGQKYPALKDILSFLLFVGAVALGTFILNSFIFRSYNVIGGSMENTLQSGDRVIVNRIPVSLAHLNEQEYIPERGQIIVFANGGNSSIDKGISYRIRWFIPSDADGRRSRHGLLLPGTQPHLQ